MPLSLLRLRKHLQPLTWLLGFALLISVSPHLTQGLVLCIGESHVEVEASGPLHHASIAGMATSSTSAELRGADGSAFKESGAPCIDVPLRAARGSDLCHQAVSSHTAGVDVPHPKALLAAAAGLLFARQRAAQQAPARSFLSSDVPAPSFLRTLGSVALLI